MIGMSHSFGVHFIAVRVGYIFILFIIFSRILMTKLSDKICIRAMEFCCIRIAPVPLPERLGNCANI